jgi:hypothetical protein
MLLLFGVVVLEFVGEVGFWTDGETATVESWQVVVFSS